MMTKEQALDKLLTLARELAAEGPATRRQDCADVCNELTILVLALAGETPAQHGAGWET